MQGQTFSARLSAWLKNKSPKTIAQLDETFAEKSFAVAFLLLMATAAIPIPTGGITHVFEVITLLLAAELIAGRRTIWLPKRWRSLRLGKTLQAKALPKLIKFIRWFERYSRPRMSNLLQHRLFLQVVGLVVFVFTLAAFLAVPFSGLDTLPALGVMLISLSLLLEDIFIFIGGIVVGATGIAISIGLGTAFLTMF